MDTSKHLHIISNDEYLKLISPEPSEGYGMPDALAYRSKLRLKEVMVYEPVVQENGMLVGEILVTSEMIDTWGDVSWDNKIEEIEEQFDPAPNTVELPSDYINMENVSILKTDGTTEAILPLYTGFHTSLEFTKEVPFIESPISKSTLRFYHKDFSEEADKIDLSKFKIVDRGEVNEYLHYVCYTNQVLPVKPKKR